MIKSWPNSINGVALLVGAAALLNIALWAAVLTTFPNDTPAAILHYSVGVGVDFIGEGRQIIMLPIAGAVILVLNALVAYILRKVSTSAGWMLLGGSVIIQVIFLMAYAYILTLN